MPYSKYLDALSKTAFRSIRGQCKSAWAFHWTFPSNELGKHMIWSFDGRQWSVRMPAQHHSPSGESSSGSTVVRVPNISVELYRRLPLRNVASLWGRYPCLLPVRTGISSPGIATLSPSRSASLRWNPLCAESSQDQRKSEKAEWEKHRTLNRWTYIHGEA